MTAEGGSQEQPALLRQVKGERDRLAGELAEAHAVIRRQQDTIDRLVEQQEHWQVLLRDAQTELRQFHRSLLGPGADVEAPQGFVQEAAEAQPLAGVPPHEAGQPAEAFAPDGQDEPGAPLIPADAAEGRAGAGPALADAAEAIPEAVPGQQEPGLPLSAAAPADADAGPPAESLAAEESAEAITSPLDREEPEAAPGDHPAVPQAAPAPAASAAPDSAPVSGEAAAGVAAFAPGSLRARHGPKTGSARRNRRR